MSASVFMFLFQGVTEEFSCHYLRLFVGIREGIKEFVHVTLAS